MTIHVLNKDEFITSTWSGGKTTQMFLSPANVGYEIGKFDIRISSATIEIEESNFSKLPGYDRIICTLNNDILIQHNDEKKTLLKPLQLHTFSGDDITKSFGQCTDFNVIYKRNFSVNCNVITTQQTLDAHKTYFLYVSDDCKVTINDSDYNFAKGTCVYITHETTNGYINLWQPHPIIVVEF
ncbi:HutD family protein [Carnobacteriaceae bacterium zg-ZUI252]|nr:HutD family protein [Carnobacteriaceae bacterium zg-ZUI252]